MDILLESSVLGEEGEAEIKSWRVADGAHVTEGETILEVETGKTTVEIPSPGSGRIQILAKDGSIIELGEVIARLL